MAAIITGSILPQNFELIRDRIVTILGDELGNQYLLDSTYPQVKKVWCERFIPFNAETELPAINVSIAHDEFDNETVLKSIGTVIYNIDISTIASTDIITGPGDQYAMIIMNKIVGMVRAILTYNGYSTLGFPPGIIQETSVVKYFVIDKGMVADALSSVAGRIQFMVKCIEVSNIVDNSVPIKEVTTTTLLNGSDFGYFYDYRQMKIAVAASGATLTNSFFSNPINEIDLLNTDGTIAAIYLLGTDFTQSGTTITGITFSFVPATNIIAKT
jgi:hypothetical protein